MQTDPPHDHPPEAPPYDVVPPADTLGVRHIVEALADLPFPMTRDELMHRAGGWRIPVTGAHFHTLGEFLEGVRASRFRDPAAVAQAIGKANRHLAQ